MTTSNEAITTSEGKSFSFWKAAWHVNTHPGVAAFEDVLPSASWKSALFWTAVVAFFSNAINLLGLYVLYRSPQMEMMWRRLPPAWRRAAVPMLHPHGAAAWGRWAALFLGSQLVALLISLLGQLFNTAVAHLVAKLLEGDASFGESFYVITLADLPAWMVVSVISGLSSTLRALSPIGSVIALLLSLVSFLLLIYIIALNSFGLAAAHHISTGKGVLAALAPIIVGLLFSCCLYGFIIFGFIASGGL